MRLCFREVGLCEGEVALLLAAAEARLRRGDLEASELLVTEAQKVVSREAKQELHDRAHWQEEEVLEYVKICK